jgi:hypothetical protein
MTRRQALLGAAVIAVSVVAILIGLRLGQRRQGPAASEDPQAPEFESVTGEMVAVDIYFPGPGGRLFAEEREVPIQEDLVTQLAAILDGLLEGPRSSELFAALPPETTVAWLHLNPAGVLYVDLDLAAESPVPAWGSRQEMLAVYSVVNTLLAAAPEIRSVVLLRDGQQRATFAGHLDTSRPLLANPRLVAQR